MTISATLQVYEQFLQSLQLYPELFKIKDVEMDLTGELNPSNLLDHLFFNENNWLSFDDFYAFYLNKYKDIIKSRFSFPDFDAFANGLRARLYRTQFGFLTEYHAYHLCRYVFGENSVRRSVDLDIAGVDFQLLYHSSLHNIHIFVDTPRAWSFRNYKSNFKNVNNTPGTHVNLPYSLQADRFNSLRFLKNKFGVYTADYLEFLKREIDAGKIKDNNISGTTHSGFVYSF